MVDQTTGTEGGGEIVQPIMDYTPEIIEPEPDPGPSVPLPTDGSSILDGPQYPAPGEIVPGEDAP